MDEIFQVMLLLMLCLRSSGSWIWSHI